MGILKPDQVKNLPEISRRGAFGVVAGAIVAMTTMKTGALADEVKVLKVSKVNNNFDYAKLVEEKFGSTNPQFAENISNIVISLENDPAFADMKQEELQFYIDAFLSFDIKNEEFLNVVDVVKSNYPNLYTDFEHHIHEISQQALVEGEKIKEIGDKAKDIAKSL